MKKIWKKLYLGLAILGMFVPLQVNAEEQDTVTLQEENSKVAVSLGMSHAKEEKISTLSISLSVDMGGQNQGQAVFDFDSGLESVTEHDYIYNENTGIMDIYVSSLKNQSLFGDGELRLGHVRIEPEDSSAVLQVEVGYCDGSFQTANASYGNKTPVISSLPEPVLLQVGAVTPSQPGGSSDSGSQGGGENAGQSGGDAGHGNDNMSQGLYDEETRFTNNPADAQNITSTVVKENNLHPELVDMSKGSAAQIGNKTLAGSVGAGAGAAKGSGKVSVVAPKEGPDSIVVNGGAGGAAGEGTGGGEDGISGTYGEGSRTDGDSSLSGEIRLDKKNGGAVVEKDNAKMKWIIGGIAAAVLVIAGIVIFILAGKRSRDRKHKKPVRRKKKRPAGKKGSMDGERAEHPARKRKTHPAPKRETPHKGSGNRRR